MTWLEERDSDKGDLSCHTLFGRTWPASQREGIYRTPSAYISGVRIDIRMGRVLFISNSFTPKIYMNFCIKVLLFIEHFSIKLICFHLLCFSVNYIFFCSQVLCLLVFHFHPLQIFQNPNYAYQTLCRKLLLTLCLIHSLTCSFLQNLLAFLAVALKGECFLPVMNPS